MKQFLTVGWTSMLAAALLLGAGCKTKPKNLTAFPATDARGGSAELGSARPIGVGPGVGSGTGLGPGAGFGPGTTAGPTNITPPTEPMDNVPLPTDPFTGPEDRETLKSNTVYFDFDKSTVKKGEQAKIAAVADYLKAHQEAKLQVEGHCDERGTEGYNLALGERRALAIRESLIGLGVPAANITTVTLGESRPADVGHDESAWSKNRRAEFVVFGGTAGAVR
jgi:peptidoglycan-associated lipoprotein